MNIRKRLPHFSALLLLLLSCVLHANPSTGFGEDHGDMRAKPVRCNLPAPTNFHPVWIGPDKVLTAWDLPSILPFEYNILVYKIGNPIPEQDFNIPGIKTDWLIENLAPNTKYEIVLTPTCGVNDPGKEPGVMQITTIITDLVAIGFTPSNSTASCTMDDPNEFCAMAPNPGYLVTFKLQHDNHPEINYTLGFFRGSGVCSNKVKLVANNSSIYSQFKVFCNSSTSPNPGCSGEYVTITFQEVTIAKVFYVISAETSYQLGCSFLANGYSLSRIGGPAGAPSSLGACGNNLGDDSDDREMSVPDEAVLSAYPNPFTDQLEIQIPYAIGNENSGILLYDLQGRQIMTGSFPGDQQTIRWNTASLMPGMYFLRVQSGGIEQTIKVVKTQ
jgi:hypothetical protein